MKRPKTIFISCALLLGLMAAAPALAELQIQKVEIEVEGVQSQSTGEGEVIITKPEIQEVEPGTVIMPAPTEEKPTVVYPKGMIRMPAKKVMTELDVLLKEVKRAKDMGNQEGIEEIEGKIEAIEERVEAATGEVIGIPAEKSIEARTGQDITNYYKVQVGELMREKMDTDQRITMLKELRDEIDNLIEELIKSKEEITSEEMGELVEEIRIKPNQIQADDIRVQTTAKKVIAKLNETSLEVKPTSQGVSIKEGDIEVKAEEITIKSDGAIMVGQSEVKVTPSQIITRIQTQPKEIQLSEEGAKAVYKVKVSESRKLFGFIPIRITKNITASAVNAEIIKEKLPWWSFLTSR